MRTQSRLTAAYQRAKVVEFDADSRFVFFSDNHRGDGSRADEFAPNNVLATHALAHYFDEGYTLVEAGDNDDLWEFPHIKHIVRAHSQVYGKLQQFHALGRYLRLFGNHDMQLADPRYVAANLNETFNPRTGEPVPLLPDLEVQGSLVLREKTTGQDLLVVHGHQGDFSNDDNWRVTMWSFRLFWRWLHAFGIKSPASPIRNVYKRHKVERNYVKWIRAHKVALICGHTHRPRFADPDETPYFNCGSSTYNGYITCLELEGGALSLVRWRVEADDNGYLHVVRWVLEGPQPLAAYDRQRRPGVAPDAERARHEALRAASRRVTARNATRAASKN